MHTRMKVALTHVWTCEQVCKQSRQDCHYLHWVQWPPHLQAHGRRSKSSARHLVRPPPLSSSSPCPLVVFLCHVCCWCLQLSRPPLSPRFERERERERESAETVFLIVCAPCDSQMVQPVSDACKHRVLARSKLPCIPLDSPFLPPRRLHLLSLASRDLEPWTQPLLCVISFFWHLYILSGAALFFFFMFKPPS